jgi:hypothetical protein
MPMTSQLLQSLKLLVKIRYEVTGIRGGSHVIQATGRSEFEEGLGSGDLVHVGLLISHECPHWVA